MSLEDFLSHGISPGATSGSRCSICKNEKLAKEVASFVEKRQNGEVSHSIHWIWFNYFGPAYGMGSDNTLRNHIRLHLGILDL